MDFGINLRILDFRSDAEGAKQRTKIMCQNKEGVALPRSCSAVLHSPRSLLNLPVPKWPQIAWQYPSKTTEARNMQLLFRPTIATKWNCRKLSFDISSSKNNSTNVCCGQFFFSALSPYTQKKKVCIFYRCICSFLQGAPVKPTASTKQNFAATVLSNTSDSYYLKQILVKKEITFRHLL